MISISNLTKEFGGTALFSGVSFQINPRDRIGLAGSNGAGKSTLLKILNDQIAPDQGVVAKPSETTIGYLPQEKQIDSTRTIVDEAMQAFSFLKDQEQELHRIQEELANSTYDEGRYASLLSRMEELSDMLKYFSPDQIRGDAERYLAGLGFQRHELVRTMDTFSQGWQMRVELAKLLLARPSVLLLDEPTNHLDIESIQWLEDFLVTYSGAVVVVSHDRLLLDHVTNRTLEINNGKLYDYQVSYSEYIGLRDAREEQTAAAFDNQQKKIKEIERFIERFRYKASKARQVQSRVKMLEKMDKVTLEDLDKHAIYFRFPTPPHSGKITVEGHGVGKNYGAKEVLRSVDFQVLRGEKVAFVGRNGEGKSTLARIIAEHLDHEGEVKLGHQVSVGYFAQDQNDRMDPELTVFDTVDQVAVGDIRTRIKELLGAFLFRGDDLDKKVKVLSGGEKSRLSMVRLLLSPRNFLLLDEPTNHLDIRSKEVLKAALLEFEGTVVIVSHDRDFLQGLTSRLYEFGKGHVKEHLGDVNSYLEKRRIEALAELNRKEVSTENRTEDGPSENKIKYEQKKEQDKELRKLAKEISRIEELIHTQEQLLDNINARLANPEQYTTEIQSGALFREHDQAEQQLAALMVQWEELLLKQEEMQS